MDALPSQAQIRAGRALLGWSQERLAGEIGGSRRTVATFEGGGTVKADTVLSMKAALEAGGIVFIGEGETEGVRRNGARPEATAGT